MSKLRALVEEVDAALEIHIAGRSETRFNRTAFILADDGVELASKLFLQRRDPQWSDNRPNNSFKNFHEFTSEVEVAAPQSAALIASFRARRNHRNGFFHSTSLLELTLPNHRVDEALIDLCDYCALLFGQDWHDEVEATAFMQTAEALIRLDRAARSDAHLRARVAAVLASVPRQGKPTQRKGGCVIVLHSMDQYAMLAVRFGDRALRDQLRALLPHQA